LSTDWQQPVDNPGRRKRLGGLVPPGPLLGVASAALKAVASSTMEGTSGTANPGLLRGRTGDAALGPGGVRVSDVFAAVTLRKRVT